jgi:glycosyltransferase involved in cell wall biosynthesis
MKIAQISPLYESVPPRGYGGTERVVSYLTEELVRQGHEVTLFASGDSKTSAKLFPISQRSLRLDQNCVDPMILHTLLVEKIFEHASGFDIIHSHIDYLIYPMARKSPAAPVLSTLHGRLDLPHYIPLYKEFPDMPVISISDAQRKPLPWINWQATVHHGLPKNLYSFREQRGGYLAFVGRMSPEKRVDLAVEIAIKSGMSLKIAAKVDKNDREYFESIRHVLDHPLVDFIGEIPEDHKNDFIGNAAALVFPIDWPEPFGLVMIEALACGTPVIARRCGSVPEIIEHGKTGFIVDMVDEAVEAVRQIPAISRRQCREAFEARFTNELMAKNYLSVYHQYLKRINPYGESKSHEKCHHG